MVIESDRWALFLATRIGNTKDVEGLWISESLVPEMMAPGRAEALGDLQAMAFERGMLPMPWRGCPLFLRWFQCAMDHTFDNDDLRIRTPRSPERAVSPEILMSPSNTLSTR